MGPVFASIAMHIVVFGGLALYVCWLTKQASKNSKE